MSSWAWASTGASGLLLAFVIVTLRWLVRVQRKLDELVERVAHIEGREER